ncbi:MAG TPA: DUF1015 domain-containing protein [Bryobacteraceae bacterium]|nr:DUF1015 domain-containing protein [Bryobacteraceae bacterium]
MARIFPFQPYRYSSKAGDLKHLVTQPYDKISPDMQARYLAASPHNLVRIILGERFPSDTGTDNVYTRAAKYFNDWIAAGILVRDSEPAFYAYFQDFTVPDSHERLTRKGFIGLGAVEEYTAGVVHRHEQTLSGPKKDRRQVLEHTRAHFGQIFMLYGDPERRIDRILDEAARGSPVADLTDEYDAVHRLYRIDDPATIENIRSVMSDRKLLIADGHHRYETALAFKHDHPELDDAGKVMMTFVNMHSPGLRILATHRVLRALGDIDREAFLKNVSSSFTVAKVDSFAALRQIWEQFDPEVIRIGVAFPHTDHVWLLTRPRQGALDVRVLHEKLIEGALGVSAEAVRDEQHIRYIRGLDTASHEVRNGNAQIGFLLEPTTIEQVADTSFAGGVMPQKSTDFYPKLLSGLTIYRLEK